MSCKEIRELFSDHLDGALSLEDEDRFGRHLEVCPGCREELDRYEVALGALVGRHPEPPPGLGERTARRLASEGLLARPSGGFRSWPSFAAALAVLAIGLALGRWTAPGAHERPWPEPGLATQAWADACAGAPPSVPPLDPRALRALPLAEGPDNVVRAGSHVLHLPRRLTSHGPFEPDPSGPREREGQTCLPLSAPFGTRLALSVTPALGGSTDGAGTFVVEVDPTRVLYARVLWSRDGLRWSLEGRAAATELLDIAREIAAGTRVERAGADRTL
jgi:anti-sigma factor RsiW